MTSPVLDNRLAIFPVHRSVRFVLLTCTPGRETTQIRCRFGLTRVDELEAPIRPPLVLSRRLLTRLSGEDDLGIPELASETDLAIVEAVSASVPRLGAKDGWHVAFGRELNASDDRDLFVPIGPHSTGRPVVEGKQIDPFRVAIGDSRFEVKPSATPIDGSRVVLGSAYRDVASATNRLTLIAAIIPARAVTTHTLFCLRTPLPLPSQRVLCALLNSYVANYLIRLRVNTHVTVSLVSRLPVPVVQPDIRSSNGSPPVPRRSPPARGRPRKWTSTPSSRRSPPISISWARRSSSTCCRRFRWCRGRSGKERSRDSSTFTDHDTLRHRGLG